MRHTTTPTTSPLDRLAPAVVGIILAVCLVVGLAVLASHLRAEVDRITDTTRGATR